MLKRVFEKALLACLLAVLAFAGSAAALSDAEYKKMMKDSPEFAEADKELTQAWNDAKKALGKNDFENLKKEQKVWVDSGRDKRAEKLIADGMPSDAAYAVATSDRAKELRGSIIQYGSNTRHEAYMKAARIFVKEHKFPDGGTIFDEDLGLEDFSGNKLAICDVNGDGQPELVIMFEATHMVAKMGYVCGFDEKVKKLTVLLDCPPFWEFYDNGCVKIDASHNQGLAGRFWPYGVSKYNKKTGTYEDFGSADAWDKEQAENDYEGNPFPDKVDKTGDGMVYYIYDDSDKSLDGREPVDTPVYDKWEAKWKGNAKLIEPDWVSADDKGLKALDKM